MTDNIHAHDHPESDRARPGGFTLWFTGLSGSGKSTIAHVIGPELDKRGLVVEYLDGDSVRQHLSKGLGFSKEDRDTNIERIGWVASRLTRQGGAVIAAAISPYRETRAKARELVEEFGPFVEVFVATSLDECARRDVNGLYAKAFAGEIKGFTGVDDPYEEPESPEIVVETEGKTPEESAQVVVEKLEQLGLIRLRYRHERRRHGSPDQAPWGELVDRTGAAPEDLDDLKVVQLTSRELSDLDMLASGALSPLEGFMGQADYESVLENMRLSNGLPWSLPVCLAVDGPPQGDRVALADESGTPVALLEVEGVYDYDKEREAELAYRTTDQEHPGVARLYEQKPMYLAGKVTVFERATPQFPELARDPASTRTIFAERGWRRVVGFQTRNPIHRAHEYLTKVALETVDGLMIHPLVGDTKGDDVPAATRVACYDVLVRNYYPADRVLVSAFPAAMRYAGPREAIWHAICRKNYGCSHFIVGRDHAGVGSYYGTYDAQLIFDEFEPHELDIEPMFFEHSFWCKVCGSMASAKTCPHDADDHVFLSGTKVREMLGNGELPPVEFSRPEVAEVLIEAYKN